MPFSTRKLSVTCQIQVAFHCYYKKTQGSSAAKSLISSLEELLSAKQIVTYGLSVKNTNPRAIRFYEKMGLSIEHQQGKTIFMKKNITN
ncbi:GNAT family N-acetyltransferase [Phaeodactylibacter xiamenensis]|uniref:GNAT family N-acetyltransferase n=1 Tax=Phaeodactylibacter xiamenensis TaxID=1524460 RepID=UPI003CCBCE2C